MIVACLGTTNYYTTVPFMVLIAASGAAMIRWPEWMKRHSPERPPRQRFAWLDGPGPDSPAWVVRLCGLILVALAVVFIGLAIHEARTDPNCVAGGIAR